MADVVVVGGANLDIKAICASPHLAATSNPGAVTVASGGVGRNIAHNLARLGIDVSLITVLGEGSEGERLMLETAGAGVDLSNTVWSALPTGSYVATLDADGELVTAVNDMRCLEDLTPAALTPAADELEAARWIIADCNLPAETLAFLASRHGAKLIAEPVSVKKAAKLRRVLERFPIAMATPNHDQLTALTDIPEVAAASAALRAMGVATVVMHAGSEGAFVSAEGVYHHSPAVPPEKILDVTGGGDAAVAGLVAGLAHNLSLVDAAKLGQRAAAAVLATTQSTLSATDANTLLHAAGLTP
jgi:pseudouridine kinase